MRSAATAQGVLHAHHHSEDGLVFSIIGPLDSNTTGLAWRTALNSLQLANPRRLIIDAARLTYCDGAGAALLRELCRRQSRRHGTYEIRSLDPAYQALLDLYERSEGQNPEPAAPAASPVEQIGRATVMLGNDIVDLIAFVGELCAALGRALRHPDLVRWRDRFLTAFLLSPPDSKTQSPILFSCRAWPNQSL